MFAIDKNSNTPVHDQIINNIMYLIAKGVLKVDDKLPSVRTLASELLINPNTISKAYQKLEERKVVYSVNGKGCYVSDNINNAKSDIIDKNIEKIIIITKTLLSLGVTIDEIKKIIEGVIL